MAQSLLPTLLSDQHWPGSATPLPRSPAALPQSEVPCQKGVRAAAEGPGGPASSWQADGLKKELTCLWERKVFRIKKRRPGSHTSMMLTDGILLLWLFLGNCGRREEDDRCEKAGGLTGITWWASSMSMRKPLYSKRVNRMHLLWPLFSAAQEMDMVRGSVH